MLGPFWGPVLSKKSVVCRSKMSLTCGPLKDMMLAPSGHPKSIKFEIFFWLKFDRFSDDGDKQCIRINVFFLRSWCYFSSSAVALLVGISKFKHIYEAELQLSTRFPFHCQDRIFLSFWFLPYVCFPLKTRWFSKDSRSNLRSFFGKPMIFIDSHWNLEVSYEKPMICQAYRSFVWFSFEHLMNFLRFNLARVTHSDLHFREA